MDREVLELALKGVDAEMLRLAKVREELASRLDGPTEPVARAVVLDGIEPVRANAHRRAMTDSQRKAVSRRMKKYWATRRAHRRSA